MDAFWTGFIWPLIIMVAESVLLLVILLIVDRLYALADRKIWAAVQIRRGPNVVGPWGLVAVVRRSVEIRAEGADHPRRRQQGRVPAGAAGYLRAGARGLGRDPDECRLGDRRHQCRRPLHLRDFLAQSIYGIIMAGWASNSKYPFLAALRSAAQMVSYEVSIGFVIITVLLCVGSLNLSAIVEAQNSAWGFLGWYWLPLLPMFVVFFVSALAETNRPPFDLVEAESELVAGFMVEYGSTPYMMFMLGEYVAIATMCAMATILFLGGWLPPFPVVPFTWIPGLVWFVLKAGFMFFMFAMVKAFVPRYRYDQLMRLGWKVFLPISLAMVVIVAGVLEVIRG